jgi:hypothetical protein
MANFNEFYNELQLSSAFIERKLIELHCKS